MNWSLVASVAFCVAGWALVWYSPSVAVMVSTVLRKRDRWLSVVDARTLSWQHGQFHRVASFGEVYGLAFLAVQVAGTLLAIGEAAVLGVSNPSWVVSFYGGSDFFSGYNSGWFWCIGANAVWCGGMRAWWFVSYDLWDNYEKLAHHAETLAEVTAELKAIRSRA